MAEKTSRIRCTGCGQPFATVSTDDSDVPGAVLAALPQQGAPSEPRGGVVLTMRLRPLAGRTVDLT
jgi:hypothetical protein